MKNILRSLNHRNYRLFFSGQLVSLIGTWMQQVAMSWLVYHLTSSAFMLGLITFFSQIPIFLLSPFAGVFTDRWNKHKALIITQTFSMIQAFIIAILTLTGIVQVWHIIVLSLMIGFINAFDMPIRQAFVIEMIEDRKDLGNAIALNSSMVNGARLFGPAIAGILVSAVGEGMCFLINGISFIAVIVALFFMRIKKVQIKIEIKNIFLDLKEGFKYSFGFAAIRDVLILIAVISLIGMPYTVLMPIFAKDILKGGSDVLGFLMASTGVGALIGGIFLANKKSVTGLGKIMAMSTAIFGITLVIFSLSKILWFSIIILLFVGFGMITLIASTNTFLQTITDDEMRGRVMGYFTMAFIGISPFGSLISGGVADAIGAPYTLMISGIIVVICSIIFYIRLPFLRKLVRPVYIKKGIIS
ncbi:MAG: MFS transporter [Actinobacteria bacterium]|nr:MFS transporter [Cyanobacteriota bacterium]MCL5771331.1 MFS transporter [Actinomycetota bacterium]